MAGYNRKEKPRFFPETPAPGVYPDDLNPHLQGVWCDVRNAIQSDQQAVVRCLERISATKREIKFLKARIVANHTALSAISEIKED